MHHCWLHPRSRGGAPDIMTRPTPCCRGSSIIICSTKYLVIAVARVLTVSPNRTHPWRQERAVDSRREVAHATDRVDHDEGLLGQGVVVRVEICEEPSCAALIHAQRAQVADDNVRRHSSIDADHVGRGVRRHGCVDSVHRQIGVDDLTVEG